MRRVLRSSESRIVLTGIRATGRHGANPGEKLEAQEFLVDLEVTVEVRGDSIEGTVDYRVLAEAVRKAVADTSFELLESLAGAVASVVGRLPGVLTSRAVVHKPTAARSLDVSDVSAEVTSP